MAFGHQWETGRFFWNTSKRIQKNCSPRNFETMKYESVIWDWNGTLLDDVVLAVEIVNDLFQEHGVGRLTTEQYRELFDFPVTLYYERAGLDSNRHDFNMISERFCDRFEREFHRVSLFSP